MAWQCKRAYLVRKGFRSSKKAGKGSSCLPIVVFARGSIRLRAIVQHSKFSIPCRLRSNSKAILISIAGFFIKPYAKCAWPMLSLILSCLLVHRVLHPGKLNSNHKRATDDRASLRLMQYAWFNRVGWFRTPAHICSDYLGKGFYIL